MINEELVKNLILTLIHLEKEKTNKFSNMIPILITPDKIEGTMK